MQAYFVSRAVELSFAGQARHVPAAANFDAPTVDTVIVPAQNELSLLRQSLQLTYPGEPRERLLRVLAPDSFAAFEWLPTTLGVRDSVLRDAAAAPATLAEQLRALRQRHPARRNFRILLHNGFGSNLGDTLIGLTAFRHVLSILRRELPEPVLDVALGWHRDDSLARLFRQAGGFERILTQGPTLAELSRYQALFDTSELLNLPRFGQLPPVDWYLWWMGLDPAAVPAGAKRNRLAIPAAPRRAVAARLPPGAGPRVLLNPRASVALRSMPDAAAARLAAGLLERWPELRLLTLEPLPLEHPRCLYLPDATPTVDHLAALVATVDGIVGVDTFTQHLADAVGTPGVTLFASVSGALFPYYPLLDAIVLPGAERLPAWGKAKTTDAAWVAIAAEYLAAWDRLDPAQVASRLRAAMARAAVAPRAAAPTPPAAPAPPVRQRDDPPARFLWRTVETLGQQVLRRGDLAVLLGAGSGEAALPIARLVGQQGRLVAVEPRQALFQRLCANLACAGITNAETHCAMPEGHQFAWRPLHRLHPDDEFHPLQLYNSMETVQVPCWPLDAMQLECCRYLAVLAPLPLLAVLEGARATIARLRPFVLAGLMQAKDADRCAAFFATLPAPHYRVRICGLGADRPADPVAIVAEP